LRARHIRPGCICVPPACAALQLQARQRPSLGAVLQRVDGIGDTEIDERLRTDDGTRAAGAVDDNLGLGIGDDVADTQRQLAVRAADAAGDAHLAVFGERAAVHDHEVLAGGAHRRQLLGSDARCMSLVLYQLAKGLTGHVDAGKERVAGLLPAARAAVEDIDVAVAQHLGALGGAGRNRIVATVAQHETHRSVRNQARQAKLEPAVWQRHREEEMPLAELPVLAHVQKRNFGRLREPRLQGCRIDQSRHASPPGHNPNLPSISALVKGKDVIVVGPGR
jgi:hypothetical protein